MIRYLWILLLLSCSKENGGKWFWISEGSHYSTPIGNKVGVNRSGNEWEWEVLFDSSCLYTSADLRDSSNIGDINKLVGFSDCGLNHSQNSFRIGWRPSSLYSDSLELLSYVRRDGMFTFTPITTITTNELIFIYLTFSDTTHICCINGICDTTERVCSEWEGRKRALFPYFGGDETSPHNMRIWIKNLDI